MQGPVIKGISLSFPLITNKSPLPSPFVLFSRRAWAARRLFKWVPGQLDVHIIAQSNSIWGVSPTKFVQVMVLGCPWPT